MAYDPTLNLDPEGNPRDVPLYDRALDMLIWHSPQERDRLLGPIDSGASKRDPLSWSEGSSTPTKRRWWEKDRRG